MNTLSKGQRKAGSVASLGQEVRVPVSQGRGLLLLPPSFPAERVLPRAQDPPPSLPAHQPPHLWGSLSLEIALNKGQLTILKFSCCASSVYLYPLLPAPKQNYVKTDE